MMFRLAVACLLPFFILSPTVSGAGRKQRIEQNRNARVAAETAAESGAEFDEGTRIKKTTAS